MRIRWTETALVRVEEISGYIALDDVRAAEQWVEALFDLVDSQLSEFPESGRVVPELESKGVRELVYGAYRVFYRLHDSVEVLTVRHGSQLLREDEFGD